MTLPSQAWIHSMTNSFELIDQSYQLMIQQLVEWAHINSGSDNLDGLKVMHQTLKEAFIFPELIQTSIASHPIEHITDSGQVTLQQTGDVLVMKMRPEAKHQVVLCGHMDTVFPIGSEFQRVKELEPGVLNGPGVTDMKGGLMVMLYALKAFELQSISEQLGWTVIINADEEIGSLGSRSIVDDNARSAQVGLVYEPATTPEGVFAGQRKGSGKFSIIVEGKTAHAGRAFYEGRNAVSYLSALVAEIHALNELKEGFTINVGYFHGGGALNVVPDKAVAKVDIRFESDQQGKRCHQLLASLIDKYHQDPEYQVHLKGHFSRPPKPLTNDTLKLFSLLKSLGGHLGLEVQWQASGGCCDGNNLAALGLPVIDTLGVRGNYIHRFEEYIVLESLKERAKLSCLLLTALAQGSIQELVNDH